MLVIHSAYLTKISRICIHYIILHYTLFFIALIFVSLIFSIMRRDAVNCFIYYPN